MDFLKIFNKMYLQKSKEIIDLKSMYKKGLEKMQESKLSISKL